ncbi:MAG: autotransporter-associated beta strand repeat-containing protein [Verrucomicrobiaceae bacterium]|nr:autotransporter-associated beta strand repeat-containing protein [Verrucomicrobiaceae bacterium]
MKNTKLTPWTRFVGSVTALVLIPFGTMPRVYAADQTWTGATDQLWSTSTNWTTGAPGSGDNVILPLTIPSGGSTITLGASSLANSLSLMNAYTLTGGDLTLTTGGVRVNTGVVARVNSILAGSAGLTLTGGGSLRLAAGNTYTGVTSISNGSLVISDATALGADTSAIVVNGSPTRGFGGGSLVLEGGYSSGVTSTRNLSLSGLGPISDRSAALNSVGTNTISGAVSMAAGATPLNTRAVSTSGRLTFAGGLDVAGTAATTISFLGGASNTAGAGSYAITGALTGSGTLEKSGAGTLFLTPSATTGFSGTLRMSSSATGTQSSVRLTAPIVLGTRTSTTGGSVIDMNGGILEVMMDAPLVQSGSTPANANVYQRAGANLYVDHALGSTVKNGTLTLGAWAFEENQTAAFNARNGYNVTIGAAPVQGGNANSTFTNNLAGGTLTFTGAFWSNSDTGADRTMIFGGNGNTTISGNVVAATAAAGIDHNLTKQGTGTLMITSTGSTLDGNVNIQGGTVQITDFRSITNNTASVNIGNTTTTGTLTIGTTTSASAAGLTTSKVLALGGTTGGAVINARQTGANPVIVNSGITQTGLGSKILTLGGTSTVENIINGVISDNATTGSTSTTANMGAGTSSITLASVDGVVVGAAVTGSNIAPGTTVATVNAGTRVITLSTPTTNTGTVNAPVTIGVAGLLNLTGLNKTDGGTWALSGTNTYTGATSLLQGTLKLKPTTGASAVIVDTSAINLGVSGNVQNSGGTLELVAVNNTATAEALGSLVPLTGASTIKLTGTGTGSASFSFASLGTVANGTGVNFNTTGAVGGTVTLTGTSGFVNPHLTFNGSDFAYADGGAVLRAPVYGTDVGSNTTAAGPLVATSYNEVTGNVSGIVTATINGLKINGANTLTLNASQTLTVRTGAAGTSGGILATGGSSTITGGTGITTGGTGDLAVIVDSGSQLTIASVLTNGTTGGLTKNGKGTLVLSAANAQTGATNINEGTVQLSGTGRLSGANVTTNIRTGATLDLNGVASGTAIGQFNGGGTVTNTNATAATLTVGNNNGAGTFSGIIQSGTGVVNVTKLGTGGQTWSGANTYTGVTSIASTGLVSVPILANIGTASGIGRGDSTSLATNQASLVFTGTTGGISYTGTTTANTDRLFTFNGSAANSGGRIENNSAVNAPLSFTNTGAIAFGVAATVAQTLTLGGTSTADNTFAPQITDNGALRTALNKTGAGIWVLTNTANSFTGITTIGAGTTGGGVLQAVDGSTLPTNSPLLLGAGTTGGGQFQTSGNFTRNLAATPAAGVGTITLGAATATTAGVGFSAAGGKLVVAFGGVGTETALTWGSGGFMGVSGTSTGAFLLNNAISTSEVEVRNPINLNGAVRTIQVDDNANTGADFATFTGVLSGTGTSGVSKAGSGVLQLFGANTYTGVTAVPGGTLTVTSLGNSASPGASSVGDSTAGNTTAGAVTLGNNSTTGGILEYVGVGETSDRMIRLNTSTATNQIHASGSGALILTNVDNTMTNGVKTLALRGSSTAGNTISSVLTNANGGADALSVTVDGGATWILSGANTHSGSTTVSAGALGLGNNQAVGNGTLVLSNGSIFASGGDRTIGNAVTLSNNTTPAFTGDNSITLSGAFNNAVAGNNVGFTNNIVSGKSLTIGNNVANTAMTGGRTFTLNGSGDTIITGDITTSTAFGMNLTYSGTGSLTLGGSGTGTNSDWNNGTLTVSSGTLKLGNSEVIPHGAVANTTTTAASASSTTVTVADTTGLVVGQLFTGTGVTAGATVASIIDGTTFTASAAQTISSGAQLLFDQKAGNMTINPAASITATFDLNGKNETINGLTATSAGTTIIDNTSASAASLTVGANDQAVTIGGGGGVYQIQNSGGGALSLAKTGTGTANIAANLTYTGATTVSNGTLNLNGSIASPTLNVSSTGTLKLIQGVTTPANLTSVTVAATSGAAFTGGTLSFANGLGTPFDNLTTLNLGAGTGTSYLELDAGDSGTDTLTLLAPAVASVANAINFLIKDIDLSNTTTYNLLSAPSGGLSGGTYSFSLTGYTGGTLNVSDTLVSLTTGTLITNDIYWAGGTSPATTMWNTIDGTLNTNFSSDLAGTIPEVSLPGKGQKIIFAADTITGGGALSTTLEQSFKVNALEFKLSTTPANTPLSITIAPGAVASNSLNVSPSVSADGLNLFTGGSPIVNISAPFVAGANQTWTTADSVSLTSGTTIAGTTVTVANTAGLRPGMTITGSGIPAGATIVSITNGTDFVISAAATAGSSQTFYAAQQLNMSGALTGTGNITKAGGGKVVLSAASTGYAGTYFANAGITEMTNATALSGVVATPSAGAPVSIGTGGTFYYNNGTSSTVSNNLTLAGGTLSVGGNNQTYSGAVNVSADSNINLRDLANATPNTTGRNITLSGTLTGTGAITLDSVNTAATGNQLGGTLTINKAASTWNGALNMTRGTALFTNVAGGGNVTPYVGYDGIINFNQFGRVIYRNIDGGSLTRTAALNYAAAAVGELSVDNVGALASNYTLTQSGAVNLNAGSVVRLVVDTASQLDLTGGVVLNGNASVTVVGGDADSLVAINTTGISGTGNLAINDEAGAWTQTSTRLAINAASTFTGNTTLNEGILILGHKDALSTGSFSNTGAASLQAGVDLSAGGSGPVANNVQLNNTLTIAGSNNLTLSGTFSATGGDSNRTLTNSLTAGTLLISGGVNLGATGNTAARNLTVNGIGNTEISGAIIDNTAFANSLVKSGTGTLTLSNSNTYTGSTSLDQGTLAYTATNTMTGALNFGSANTVATTGSLDLSAASATFGSLVVQTDTTSANSLNIDSSQTLTITGNVTLGTARSAVTNTLLTATGGGSLVVQNTTTPPTSFVVGGTTTAAAVGNKATVDLSGLSNLTVALNTTSGVFRVNPSNSNNVNDRYSVLILPSTGVGTTTITTNSLNVGDGAQSNNTASQINQLKLGTGVNTLNANTVNIGTGSRDIGSITFNSGTGSVVLRAADGTSRAAFNMGTGGATTGVGGAQGNTFDVTGHNADLLLDAVTIGTQNRNSDLSNTFSFDTGTLDMTSLTMSTKGTNGSTTTSTLNIGGGTVLSGAWTLATATGAGSAIATANLTGGTVTLSGNINRGTDAGGGGTATGTVNLDGSTLNMSGNNIGSATNQVVFNAKSGGLSNLNELNGGGTLTKTTAGVLTMSGTNSYTGLTDIQAGEVKAGSTTGLSGGSIYSVAASSILSLNGFSSNVGGLSGAGTVQNASATAANLILGANNGSPSVSGVVIQDGTGGGALSLIKQGTGTATISGTNTFSGKTTIESGSISVATVDAATTAQPLGTNAALDLGVAATSSGTLIYTGAAGTLGKDINALGNGSDTIQNSGSGLLTLSGTLTKDGTTLNLNGGASGINVTGAIVGTSASSDLVIAGGVVTLSNANTYNGPTILNAGTLNINNANAISTGAFTINGGTIDNTSGSAITLATNNPLNINADFTFGGTNNLNLGTGAVTLNANRTVTVNGSTLTIGGTIAGNFNLTGAGAGTLLLTGASTYTGTTTVNSGATITAGGNGSLGDTSSGTNITAGGALVINNINYSDPEPLSLNGTGVGGTGALVGGSGTSTFAGPITIVTDSTIGAPSGGVFTLSGGIDKTGTVVTFGGGGTFFINGAITGNTGSPNSDLIVDATTVNLNAANTYNGPTYVRNGGVLYTGAATALPTSPARTALIIDATGSGSSMLVLANGFSQSALSLSGASSSVVQLNSNNLTIGAATGSTIYAGTISGTGGSLTKDLASALTLDQASTYSGGTTVNGGTLNVRNTSGSATGTGAVTIGASGTLSGTGAIAPDANNSIYINGSFVVGDSTVAATASSFGLTTSGTGSTVMGAGSSMSFDLFSNIGDNSAVSTAADFVTLGGTLDLTAASTLIITNPNGLSGFALGDKWKLFSFVGGAFSGAFASINDSALALGVGLYGSVTTDGSGAYYVITNVPEPTRALLLMLGLLGIGMRRRRK